MGTWLLVVVLAGQTSIWVEKIGTYDSKRNCELALRAMNDDFLKGTGKGTCVPVDHVIPG